MNTRKLTLSLSVAALGLGLAACASNPTPALVDARQAYEEARTGVANDYAPDRVREAKVALEKAEREHARDPGSYEEAHLAYLAHRRALVARAIAQEKIMRNDAIAARERQQEVLIAQREQASRRLQENTQLLSEQSATLDAERAARMKLEEIAKVRSEEQRMTITLSGEVMFKSNDATLLPTARQRLTRVADVLREHGEGKSVTILGHTDSRGPDGFNQDLSRRRAEAVRDYLVSQGVSAANLGAEGRGESQPIASNDTAEGRANNRRVEIIIDGFGRGQDQGGGMQPEQQQQPHH